MNLPKNMTRILIITWFLSLSFSYAQITLNEGFDGTEFPPPGWVTYDQRDQYNHILDYWTNDRNGPHVPPGCAFAGKFGDNPHYRSDAWLVTPLLQPTPGYNVLEFWYRGFNKNHVESLEIWISRAGNDKASFLNPLTGTLVATLSIRTWDYTKYSLSLAAYNNQCIYVGFRYVGSNTNRHGVFLDCVGGPSGPTLPLKDVGVDAILNPTDTVLPGIITLEARVKNYGNSAVGFYTRCVVETITGARIVYQDSAYVSNLQPGHTTNLSFYNLTLNGGWYKVTYKTLLAGDMQPNNDAMSKNFWVITSGYKDAGVSAIITPMGEVQYQNTYYPTIQIRNYSAQQEQIPAKIVIRQTEAPYTIVYSKTLSGEVVQPLQSKIYLATDPWIATTGTYEIIALTTLAGDQDHSNDTCKAGIICVNIDATVLSIYSPTAMVEPTSAVICSVEVLNRSWVPQELDITLKIGDDYIDTKQDVVFLGGENKTIVFDTPWYVNDTGHFAVRCSVYLAGDQRPQNDVKTSTVFVPTRDIQPLVFIYPEPTVDTLYPNIMIPRVVIQNNGNYRVIWAPINLKIYKILPDQEFSDSLVYNEYTNVNIYEGSTAIAYFPDWDPSWSGEGNYRFDVKAEMLIDQNRINDTLSLRCYIKSMFRDIALTQIRSPNDTIAPGYPVIPKINCTNNGNVSLAFGVVSEIYDGSKSLIWVDTSYVSTPLPPGYSRSIYTKPFTPPHAGRYQIMSYTIVLDDDTTNNAVDRDFNAYSNVYRDVTVAAIVAPAGDSIPFGSQTIQANIINLSNVDADIKITYKVSKLGNPASERILLDTMIDFSKHGVNQPGIPGYQQLIATPEPWVTFGIDEGYHIIKCIAELEGDEHPENNIKVCTVYVYIYQDYGWRLLSSSGLPSVFNGGALTYVPNYGIYAFVGNKSNTFWHYDNNSWTQMAPLASNQIDNGASLCNDGNKTIYAIRGKNSRDFWAYNCSTNTWTNLESVPLGPTGKKKIKGGAGIVYVTKGDSHYVYLVKGNNTKEFYAYNIETNTWQEKPEIPIAVGDQNPKDGTCITTDGTNYIYLLKQKDNKLYRYAINNEVWQTNLRALTHALYPKKVGKGAALVYVKDLRNNEYLYAFKGNNTVEFWRYSIAQDQWTYLNDNMPIPPPNNKKIKAGGAMTAYNGVIYAFKGNKTSEFYKYTPRVLTDNVLLANTDTGVMANPTAINTFNIKLGANIVKDIVRIQYQVSTQTPLRIKLYDATGSLVKSDEHPITNTSGVLSLDVSKLSSGLYFLKVENNDHKIL
ncbi:MAG: choice-of-anchor J domain-containing protein, partial [candidate division WOR-3 bacterium]